MYEPSLKIIDAFMKLEKSKGLSFPLAVLIMGTFSQLETTIDLTHRICDRYFSVRPNQGPDRE